MTFTITLHDLWVVAKYFLAFLGGIVAAFGALAFYWRGGLYR